MIVLKARLGEWEHEALANPDIHNGLFKVSATAPRLARRDRGNLATSLNTWQRHRGDGPSTTHDLSYDSTLALPSPRGEKVGRKGASSSSVEEEWFELPREVNDPSDCCFASFYLG